jgi:hypothetical protein
VEDKLSLKRMLVLSWLYLAILVIGSWVMSSWSFAWGVLVGGVISIASFLVSYREVRRFFETHELQQGQSARKSKFTKQGLILKFWLRLLLIGLVLFFFIRFSSINVVGLILGLTTVVFAITLSALGVVWGYYFSRR